MSLHVRFPFRLESTCLVATWDLSLNSLDSEKGVSLHTVKVTDMPKCPSPKNGEHMINSMQLEVFKVSLKTYVQPSSKRIHIPKHDQTVVTHRQLTHFLYSSPNIRLRRHTLELVRDIYTHDEQVTRQTSETTLVSTKSVVCKSRYTV